jgi:hypothetical protein
MGIVSAIVTTFTRSISGLLPACVRDLAVSWHKNLNNTVNEGDTYPYVKDEVGDRTDDVYYGQYLDATSGQINFYRTSGTFDYTDPSDGSLVEGVSIPGTGLYTIPVNGICDIGVYPREGYIDGLLDFDGVDDYVSFSGYPDIDGNKIVKFNVYVRDLSAGFSFKENEFSTDQFIFYIDSGYFYIRVTRFTRYRIDNILPENGVEYSFEVDKSAEVVNSITINGVAATTTSVSSSNGNESSTIGRYVDNNLSITYSTSLFWGFEIESVFASSGQPSGNTNGAWDDTIGVITATVNGAPTTTNIGTESDAEYTSFYPVCERAGTVLHDVEAGIHISVATPSWSEFLYGSDWLNQYGFIDKELSDSLGYDWETIVDGTPITLNDDTLVPLKKNISLNELDGVLDFLL